MRTWPSTGSTATWSRPLAAWECASARCSGASSCRSALPLLFAGIRTAAVFVVSTATIAAIAGGGGLGDIIVNQASYRLEGVVGAAICVAALALLADLALGASSAHSPREGLKHELRRSDRSPRSSPSRVRTTDQKGGGT